VQTFVKLQRVELGLDLHNVLTATVELPEAQYAKPEQKINFFQCLQERVRALPGRGTTPKRGSLSASRRDSKAPRFVLSVN
jgi:hypothetical protein